MKTGLQLYSIKDIREEKGIKETLKAASVLGFDGVEFAGWDDLTGEELKAELEKYNLVCCGAHLALSLLQERHDEFVGILKTVNAPSVCVPWMNFDNAEGWAKFGKDMNEMGKILASEGIRLGYHNHKQEYIEYDGKLAIDILLENCDPEYVFFEFDTRHTILAGQSPVGYAEKYSGRIPFLHARDTDMTHDTAVGAGVVDFEKVVKAAGNVEWMIVENENFGKNLEELRQSAKYIRENF